MRAILGIGLALVLAGAAAAEDKKQDEKIDAKLLVGKWKQTEPKNGPQVTYEFTADGKVNGAADLGNGRSNSIKGTYKLEGNKLIQKVSIAGLEAEESDGKVLKLTADTLEMTDPFDIVCKYKRVEAKK